MAAVDKATHKSLRNANNNFSHITDVQNLNAANAGICESNKAIRGYFPQWLASYYSN